MKKLLVLIAAIVLVVWVISWFRTPDAVATSGAHPWPEEMGSLDSAVRRYPPRKANEAANKLMTLGGALPKNDAVDEYVWREVARGELTIGVPPALPDVTAMRELLLREPIVWERDPRAEVGDSRMSAMRVVQMTAGRALAASALAKARANDAAAWEDLHAVWNLSQSLDGHPVMMVQTASMALARTINALAWKMPLPAPAWLAELQQHDQVRPLVEAYQIQTASYWNDGTSLFPTKMLAASVDHDRAIAEGLLKATTCAVTPEMNKLGTDLRNVWRRAFRYRAEREATANALRIREGKPIEPQSRCSDGSWTLDGTTLRFSKEIEIAAEERPMPLVLRVEGAVPASLGTGTAQK
jgi:hypothetical protein